MMNKCNNCGFCCHFHRDGKFIKCKFLIKLSNDKTTCRVYRTRLGRVLGFNEKGIKYLCCMRHQSPYDFEDCSMNKGGKPTLMKDGSIKEIKETVQ